MFGKVLRGRDARVWAAAVAVAVIALVALEHRVPGSAASRVPVLVANRDIGLGEALTAGMVARVDEPSDAVLGADPVLAASEPGALGRVAVVPIARGRPLAWGWLSSASGAGPYLTRGMAQYALPATPADQPGGGLRAGAYVQVEAAVPADPVGASPAHAETVEAHVLVAGVSGDGRLVTIVVPRADLAALAWLKLRGATFSYGLVGVTDTRGGVERRPVTPRIYQEDRHVDAR